MAFNKKGEENIILPLSQLVGSYDIAICPFRSLLGLHQCTIFANPV